MAGVPELLNSQVQNLVFISEQGFQNAGVASLRILGRKLRLGFRTFGVFGLGILGQKLGLGFQNC